MKYLPFIRAALLALVFRVAGCKSVIQNSGKMDAQRDLKNGILAVESYGLPQPWADEYRDLLRQHYRIEQRTVAACLVNNSIIEHADGYNKIMEAEIERRFGTDIWDKTADEAVKLAERKYRTDVNKEK